MCLAGTSNGQEGSLVPLQEILRLSLADSLPFRMTKLRDASRASSFLSLVLSWYAVVGFARRLAAPWLFPTVPFRGRKGLLPSRRVLQMINP